MKDYKKFEGKGITINLAHQNQMSLLWAGYTGMEPLELTSLKLFLEMINDSRLQVGTLNLIAGNPSALEQI